MIELFKWLPTPPLARKGGGSFACPRSVISSDKIENIFGRGYTTSLESFNNKITKVTMCRKRPREIRRLGDFKWTYGQRTGLPCMRINRISCLVRISRRRNTGTP